MSTNFEFCNNLCDFCWHELVNVVLCIKKYKSKGGIVLEKTNIPEILKACRKGVNMTQAQFAKTIGIKRSAYAYYESGRTRPKIETLRTIAKVYGLDVNTLISNEDSNSLHQDNDQKIDTIEEAIEAAEETKPILIVGSDEETNIDELAFKL